MGEEGWRHGNIEEDEQPDNTDNGRRVTGMYRTLFFVGLILAVAFLIATIVLFFVLKIPKALGVVTGRTQKRAIEEIRAGGLEAVSKRSKSRSRNIHVREVEMDTGALHRSSTDSGLKDAAGAAMKDAAGAAAK